MPRVQKKTVNVVQIHVRWCYSLISDIVKAERQPRGLPANGRYGGTGGSECGWCWSRGDSSNTTRTLDATRSGPSSGSGHEGAGTEPGGVAT